MESQMTRAHGHDQTEDPIRIHHSEEEEHQEKGATKMLKKVKEKAKKIKNSLTKHGHGHEQDHDVEEEEEEEDEYDEQDPEVHGAPVYKSSVVRGGVTGQPESPEEIIPPRSKVFPVVSSDYTRPIEPEPVREASYGHEALSRPVISDREERREVTFHPLKEQTNTPVSLLTATEDVTMPFSPRDDEYLGGQRKVKTLEEDTAAPGGGTDYLSGASNYQHEVTDPQQKGGGEAGVPGNAESLGRMKVTDESHGQKSGLGFQRDSPTGSGSGLNPGLGEDFPVRSQELGLKNESGVDNDSLTGFGGESRTGLRGDYPARNDDVRVETVSERDLPTGTHDQFSPELSSPKERDDFDSKAEDKIDEKPEQKPNTYTGKIASATSVITDKAIAAKNAVVSRLGYSGETTGAAGQHETPVVDEPPKSETGYGQKLAGTVAEKLTPVYEKVKETGSTVMTKLPLSGSGNGAKVTHQGEVKGVSAKDYLAEKLTPGEEDKALSEMIAEKLHLGGGEKKTTTKEVEVTVEKMPSDQISEEIEHGETVAEEGRGGGMVGKIKGWFGGTTEAMEPKSSDSIKVSSQSLGSTVGTTGFSDSGGGGAMPVQRGLQESGN